MNPEAKEWVLELWWRGARWATAAGKGDKDLVPSSFEEVGREAKARQEFNSLVYRVRNLRTGDVIPAAIL